MLRDRLMQLREQIHRRSLGEVAEKWWRTPLALAAALFALSGPAHAMGRTDAVFYASLVGVTLGAVAVPLGLLALRYHGPSDQENQ